MVNIIIAHSVCKIHMTFLSNLFFYTVYGCNIPRDVPIIYSTLVNINGCDKMLKHCVLTCNHCYR